MTQISPSYQVIDSPLQCINLGFAALVHLLAFNIACSHSYRNYGLKKENKEMTLAVIACKFSC